MPTIKNKKIIGIIPDMHLKESLGYADYVSDRRITEKKEILDFIVKSFADCDTIVFLGDQLNGRNNKSEVIKEFVEFIEKLRGKKLYFISGNHEKTGDGKSAIDFIGEIKNPDWHIITNKVEQIGSFTFSPYFSKPELEAKDDAEGSKKLMEQLNGGDMLFIHHAISDSLTGSGMTTNLFNEIVLPKKELEKRYKLIVAGHTHSPQADGKTVIAGSIFNNEVGETQKYIWKIEENTLKVEQIKLPGRAIVKLENPLVADFDKIDKSSIVKIIITDKKFKKDIDDIKKAAKKFDAYLLLEQIPKERKKMHYGDGESMLEFSIEKLLEVYAQERKVDIAKLKNAYELIR